MSPNSNVAAAALATLLNDENDATRVALSSIARAVQTERVRDQKIDRLTRLMGGAPEPVVSPAELNDRAKPYVQGGAAVSGSGVLKAGVGTAMQFSTDLEVRQLGSSLNVEGGLEALAGASLLTAAMWHSLKAAGQLPYLTGRLSMVQADKNAIAANESAEGTWSSYRAANPAVPEYGAMKAAVAALPSRTFAGLVRSPERSVTR